MFQYTLMSFNEAYLLLSAQTALLGHIVPSLRAVTINFDEEKKMLNLRFFYDEKMTEELFDLASIVSVEIELDPNSSYRYEIMNEDIAIHLAYPEPIPIQGRLIYLRKEVITTEYTRTHFIPNEDIRPISAFRLAMQEALLGKVTPALRKVIIDLDQDEKKMFFHFFYHGQISKEDFDLANSVIQEVNRYFFDFKAEKQIIRVDYPEPILVKGSIVYSRAFS